MKNFRFLTFLFVILTLGLSTSAFAQYDDLYYNPDTDDSYTVERISDDYDNTESYAEDSDYDQADSFYDYEDEDESYGYDNDYGYAYSSRIRRFRQPYSGFGYYDPVYVDAAYYDPYLPPGTAIYVFNSYNSYSRWNRYNRYNRYRPGYNFYFGNPFGGNPYYNPYAYNPYNPYNSYNPYGNPYSNYGYSNYGNGYYGSGYGAGYNPYCPPTWSTGTYSGNYNNDNYTGPRRSGVGTASGSSSSRRNAVSGNDDKKVNKVRTRKSRRNSDSGNSSRARYKRDRNNSSNGTSTRRSRSNNSYKPSGNSGRSSRSSSTRSSSRRSSSGSTMSGSRGRSSSKSSGSSRSSRSRRGGGK